MMMLMAVGITKLPWKASKYFWDLNLQWCLSFVFQFVVVFDYWPLMVRVASIGTERSKGKRKHLNDKSMWKDLWNLPMKISSNCQFVTVILKSYWAGDQGVWGETGELISLSGMSDFCYLLIFTYSIFRTILASIKWFSDAELEVK